MPENYQHFHFEVVGSTNDLCRIECKKKLKPTLITDELATFLGRASGTEMARTEVSKEINQYIRSKKLQDESNGRIIRPDGPLKKLLRVGDDEELTYFNLQRYMKHHFIKTEATSSA